MSLIVFTLSGMLIFVRSPHFANAMSPIAVQVSGKAISSIPLLWKAFSLTLSIELSARFISFRAGVLKNALSPIKVTDEVRVTFSRFVAERKAPFPTEAIPSLRVI